MSEDGTEAQQSELLDKLIVFEAFLKDFEPNVEKITHEINPNVVALRERYETDNTMTLLKKAGDSLPVFIELLDIMNAMWGMMKDFAPAIDNISKEITPNIKILRESLEKDETLHVIQKVGENMGLMASVLDEFSDPNSRLSKMTKSVEMVYNNIGDEEIDRLGINILIAIDIFNRAMSPEVVTVVHGMIDTVVACQKQYQEGGPKKIGMFNYVSVMRDPDIQMSVGFMTSFLKNLNVCLEKARQESQVEESIEKTPGETAVETEE